MVRETWTVVFSRSAKRQYMKLKRNGSKRPSVNEIIDLLSMTLKEEGPYQPTWLKYSPLGRSRFHCHLSRGRPIFVACWRVTDKKKKEIEVYYVGTHEAAPY